MNTLNTRMKIILIFALIPLLALAGCQPAPASAPPATSTRLPTDTPTPDPTPTQGAKATQPAPASFHVECQPGLKGKIIFSVYINHLASWYEVNADGTGLRGLPGPWGDDIYWSPDGSQVAFTDGDLYVRHIDSSEPTLLMEKAEFPSWSPDSRRIAFQKDDAIYVVNIDGTGLTELVPNGYCPIWSPDGGKIAFSSIYAAVCGSKFYVDLYVMNADGSGKPVLVVPGQSMLIAWSPDGKQIAYLIDDLIVVNADGSNKTFVKEDLNSINVFSWSPDGCKIAYAGGNGLSVITLDGSGETEKVDSFPYFAWSPDGEKIVYSLNSHTLGIIGADGKTRINNFIITPGGGSTQIGGYIWLP